MSASGSESSVSFISGVIRTLDPERPVAEALGIVDGRVTVVGSTDEVLAATPAGVPVVDLAGGAVLPGFIDSHSHPLWGARLSAGVDLGGLTTLEAVRDALAAEASRVGPGGWVRGWNLDYAAFGGEPLGGAPFEDAVGGAPTFLMFYDLHTAVATRAALEAAGVTGARTFGDASEIVLGEDGRPTGELREPTAYDLVGSAAPQPTLLEERELLRATFARFNAVGLTACAVMDGSERFLDVLDAIESDGELTVRVDVFLWHRPDDDDEAVEARIALAQRAGRRWRVAGIKLFSDGVIDTGTAWLHTPDTSGEGLGSFWPDWDRYREVVRRYDAAGLQLATHAVGDRAVSAVLDAYADLPPADPSRPRRIEHLEVLSDADIDKLRGSGVVASMQPLHMQWRKADLSDSWASRLGEDRAATGFRARDVIDAGVRAVFGSDWPVAGMDPRANLVWATRRSAPSGDGLVFEPHERVSVEEAIAAYTREGSLALGAPNRGVLREGAVADLVVLAEDPVAVTDPSALAAIDVLATYVGGTRSPLPLP
jgi:predicted amidohydrolase YtcJ